MFTAEAMLSAIVSARDVQKLYEAQDIAKAKLQKRSWAWLKKRKGVVPTIFLVVLNYGSTKLAC